MNQSDCAWCGVLLRAGTLPNSHGICPACQVQVLAEPIPAVERLIETVAKERHLS